MAMAMVRARTGIHYKLLKGCSVDICMECCSRLNIKYNETRVTIRYVGMLE